MNTPKAKLTQGPVAGHLVNMTLPMLLGITTMMAQSFIDTWFLGRVGDRALAAYSFGFPILMIVTSIAIGLGAGTSSVVARAIGAEDHGRASRLTTDSLILSFLITAVVSVVGVLTIEPLFRLLGAPEDMIPLTLAPEGANARRANVSPPTPNGSPTAPRSCTPAASAAPPPRRCSAPDHR